MAALQNANDSGRLSECSLGLALASILANIYSERFVIGTLKCRASRTAVDVDCFAQTRHTVAVRWDTVSATAVEWA
jgi:hypothetical protein